MNNNNNNDDDDVAEAKHLWHSNNHNKSHTTKYQCLITVGNENSNTINTFLSVLYARHKTKLKFTLLLSLSFPRFYVAVVAVAPSAHHISELNICTRAHTHAVTETAEHETNWTNLNQ